MFEILHSTSAFGYGDSVLYLTGVLQGEDRNNGGGAKKNKVIYKTRIDSDGILQVLDSIHIYPEEIPMASNRDDNYLNIPLAISR